MNTTELKKKRKEIAEGYKLLATEFRNVAKRYKIPSDNEERQKSASLYCGVSERLDKIAARYPV